MTDVFDIVQQPVKITFANLVVLGEADDPAPLSELHEDDHIHGRLSIEIGDRIVPYMGYWNSDDVCFNSWLAELDALTGLFDVNAITEYIYDEQEQGQPAFLFEKSDDIVFFSIIASCTSGHGGDAAWQQVAFAYTDFQEQYQRMRADFFALVQSTAPIHGSLWLKQLTEISP